MSNALVKRLRWRCRRGMRELDLLLETYLDHNHASMDDTELATFSAFLDSTDMELYDWVTGRARPAQAEFAELVQRIAGVQQQ